MLPSKYEVEERINNYEETHKLKVKNKNYI